MSIISDHMRNDKKQCVPTELYCRAQTDKLLWDVKFTRNLNVNRMH